MITIPCEHTFADAITAALDGAAIARAAWCDPHRWVVALSLGEDELPALAVYQSGAIADIYTPTQADIFGDDWAILVESPGLRLVE